MTLAALHKLPEDLRALSLASGGVWEAALERGVIAAQSSGQRHGQQHGVRFLDAPAAEQRRFDASFA